MSNRTPDTRRVTLSLLGSLLLHLLGIWLVHVLITPAVEQRLFRVRVPSYLSKQPERFKPRPAVSVSRELLDRLQAETAPLPVDFDLAERLTAAPDTLPGIVDHPLSLSEPSAGEYSGPLSGRYSPPQDTLDLAFEPQPVELPWQPDPIQLDIEARRNTVVLIDPPTGKLWKAWLKLPAEGSCKGSSPAKRLEDQLRRLKWGQALRWKTPIEYRVDALPCGYRLRYEDMKQYRFILPQYVRLESIESFARYLADGGFGLVSSQMLQRIESILNKAGQHEVRIIEVEYGHPLVSSYYDIDEYTFTEIVKLTGPVMGLEIDGRLAAAAGPRYRYEKTVGYSGYVFTGTTVSPHLSNLLYINTFAYGLIQPSPMGGRYLAQDTEKP